MNVEQIADSYGKLSEQEIWQLYQTADLDSRDQNWRDNSLLHLAAAHADSRAISILLERGIDVNIANCYNERPLHALAKGVSGLERDTVAVKAAAELLLAAKASTMRKDDNGNTAVIWAAQEARYEILEVMIAKGAKLTMTDREGNTALHVSCKYINIYPDKKADFIKTIQLLLAAGFEGDQKNNYGETALDFARQCDDKQIVAILTGNYDPDNPDDAAIKTAGMSLLEAVENGDLEAVEANIEIGADFNALSETADYKGMTALGIAVQKLNVALVDKLVAAGADVNFKNGDGQTALASVLGYRRDRFFDFETVDSQAVEQIFKLLLDHNLNINDTIDNEGNTALIKACSYIDRNSCYNGSTLSGIVVKCLLKTAADVNLSNLKGQTALMPLALATRSEVADLQIEMLEAGADVAATDQDGNTVLMYAARNGEYNQAKELAELLFDFGDPHLEAVNNAGQSALEIATEADNEMLVTFLLMKM